MEVSPEKRYGFVSSYDPTAAHLIVAHYPLCMHVLRNYCQERRPHLKETWKIAEGLLVPRPRKFIDKSTRLSNGKDAHWILKQVLFAPHEGTRVPLMVELASEINPMENHVLVSDLGSTCAMFGTELPTEIALFANEYPHTLPAYIFCSMYSLRQPNACDLFTQLAAKLDHAGKDYRGFTALMMMVMQNADAEFLDISLSSCQPSASSMVLNLQDQGGKTAAHYCAMLNRRQHLETLIKYHVDLQVKDNLGHTPADLAVAIGHKEIAQLLGRVWPSDENNHFIANTEEADSFYSCIPSIFEPSFSKRGGQDSGIAGIMRYLQRELPQLLELRPDSVVVVPSIFPEDCPFSNAMPQMQKGWEAEKQVFNCMKRALNRIQAERPAGEVLLALYHGFRYGRVVTNASATDAAPKVDETAESEIDFIITCRNYETERQTAMVIEVKSGGSGQDAVRKRGGACDQLRKHFTSLKLALGAKLCWVKPCLILPNFPDAKHPVKVKMQAQENVQKELDKHGILGLFSSILNDDENLYEWLTVQLLLEESLETDEIYGNEPIRLLAWCLIKTMGTVVHHAAQTIEGQTALLTPPQKEALEHTGTKLLVLNGGYGTGKSFLAEEKMKQLHHRGWLSDTSKALFLVNSDSKAFHAIMRERLKGLDNILVERVHRVDFSKMLQNIGKLGANQHVKYVFIDHYDDFCSIQNRSREEEIAKELMPLSQRVELIWLLVNANHTSRPMHVLDQVMGNESYKVVSLERRIRNTREISSVVYQACSHSWVDGKVDSSEPSGLPGPPVRIVYFDQTRRWTGSFSEITYSFVENESRCSAMVMRMLILDENITPEDILLIHQNGGKSERVYAMFIERLDHHLVAAFQTAAGKQKTFSLAPLVLQFPWLPSHTSKDHQHCPKKALEFLTATRERWSSIVDAGTARAVIIEPGSVARDDPEPLDFVREITRARILRLWTLKVTHGLDAGTTDAEFADLEISLQGKSSISDFQLEQLLNYKGRTQIRHVMVIPDVAVDGFESNVVVYSNMESTRERTDPGGACVLSRAKVMGVMLAKHFRKDYFSKEYPSLVKHEMFEC